MAKLVFIYYLHVFIYCKKTMLSCVERDLRLHDFCSFDMFRKMVKYFMAGDSVSMSPELLPLTGHTHSLAIAAVHQYT